MWLGLLIPSASVRNAPGKANVRKTHEASKNPCSLPVVSMYSPTMWPGLLIPKALVRIAPGKSIVVKVKQHRADLDEMTPSLDNPDLGNIMLESVVIRRIGIPPPCQA